MVTSDLEKLLALFHVPVVREYDDRYVWFSLTVMIREKFDSSGKAFDFCSSGAGFE
jgi:hypothetical protein